PLAYFSATATSHASTLSLHDALPICRTMHTFKKLPRQSPRIAAATSSIGSTATRHLVEQNARRHGDVERLRALRQWNRHALRGEDRKSTRLNSSHRTISYAVFCLKKK